MRKPLNILGVLALLLLAIAAYWPVLNGSSGYVWDDNMHVTLNKSLHDGAGLGNIWTWGPAAVFNKSVLPATQQYYPATFTSFWIEYQLWGNNPHGYHITNFALHLLAALLLWHLLRKLGLSPGIAFFAAALFALHPVNVESVAWISERKNTLSLVFYLLAALAWIHWDELGSQRLDVYGARLAPPSFLWLLTATLLFTLALLAKSVTATLPVALLIVVWWKRGKISRRDVLGILPLFLVAILSSALTTYIESRFIGATGPDFALPFLSRTLLAGHAIVFYVAKLLAPFNLAFIYPHWTLDPASFVQWLFPLAVFIALAVLFVLRKKISRGPLAAALLFILALAPALGFINFYPMQFSYVADHFQYLATLVFFAFLAAFLATLFRKLPVGVKATLAALPLLFLAWLTYNQTFAYKDEITLYQKTLDANPHAWMAAENLANLLCTAITPPDYTTAKSLYYRVIADNPHDIKAYSSLSTTLMAQQNFPEAERVLEAAASIAPQDAPTQANLGNALMLQQKFDLALEHYDIAAALDEKNPETLFNWGNALFLANRPIEAEDKFRRCILLEGGKTAKNYFYLGLALRDENKPTAAAASFERATNLDPKMTDAYFELASIHAMLHHDQLAYQEFKIALRVDPNYIPAHLSLARLLDQTRDPALHSPMERIEHLQKVVALTDERNIGDLVELSDALQSTNFLDEASDAMEKVTALARATHVPPVDLELLLMRAQQLRVALHPVDAGPSSILSISNNVFEKSYDPAPSEPDPTPFQFHLIKSL